MESPQLLLTVCSGLRLQLLAWSCCPGSCHVYSKPVGQLLLSLVCQLSCWLMVRGGPVAFTIWWSPPPSHEPMGAFSRKFE